ncbi:MAG: DedA family protein [candidate division WOR-3 bacterium]|nr:MAG: DedA family protein [candidate division WOR-3 bacterium]
MFDWLVSVFDWIAGRDPLVVYLFLLCNACVESLFPPYPSDAVVLIFAYLAGRGSFNPFAVYFGTVIGSITGIMILYWLGKKKGERLVHIMTTSWMSRFFPLKMIERAQRAFSRRGPVVVFLNRFLPGMRAPICFAAGMVDVKSTVFFWLSLLSVMLWNLFLVSAGFYVGSSWQEAARFLKQYNLIVTAALIPLAAILIILYVRKRKMM